MIQLLNPTIAEGTISLEFLVNELLISSFYCLSQFQLVPAPCIKRFLPNIGMNKGSGHEYKEMNVTEMVERRLIRFHN